MSTTKKSPEDFGTAPEAIWRGYLNFHKKTKRFTSREEMLICNHSGGFTDL
jgi:hypothetical protein